MRFQFSECEEDAPPSNQALQTDKRLGHFAPRLFDAECQGVGQN